MSFHGKQISSLLALRLEDRVEKIATLHAPPAKNVKLDFLTTLDIWAKRYSPIPEIQSELPYGHAKRWNEEPGILVFENIPHPYAIEGMVVRLSEDRWIMDSRGSFAMLAIEVELGASSLVAIGEHDILYVYRVLHQRPRVEEVVHLHEA